MKISLSATNPCHLYPLAIELSRAGNLGAYYSGYPEWKLENRDGVNLRTHSIRTTIVYGLLKYAPAALRPSQRALFLWQDQGLDRWVGRNLEPCSFIHGMPGQCLHTFRAARKAGVKTVLNHATGPVRDWVKIMRPEYERAGLRLEDFCTYDAAYFAREDEEYALADFHCAASSVVRDQLIAAGVSASRIVTSAYGADGRIFRSEKAEPPAQFRIVFAGQAGLRKGIKTLLDALTIAGRADWSVDFYGAVLSEAAGDFSAYQGKAPLYFHGAVSQRTLADGFRAGSVLVLPSLEEGFGLVVPQALACGIPAIVSDRVGGKDLVRHRDNGSIVPVQNAEALATELSWWAENPKRITESFPWSRHAQEIIVQHQSLK